ncbi:hypothetical protein FF38_08133 [Lucilia cuprina]|uniref:Uncharacterized protein n=1 Tax=Lucilia cuprina TaxID=7375 RepID=A0A0L0C0J9_LUCCU|nr:hypothetical protein CVS40_2193 [Lucilia cuprina]KNC25840.1 hypothetical protein FF38_08133 [Lucilia cuprina]
MTRSEALTIKIILWTLFLQSLGASHNKNFLRAQLTGRNLYEQYTLGQTENGAKIIYTYQYTQKFDEQQPEILLDFNYPEKAVENDNEAEIDSFVTITQLQLYVNAEDGATTQAYVTAGGIGENNISLQIVANNSNLLNYMLVIYGTTKDK